MMKWVEVKPVQLSTLEIAHLTQLINRTLSHNPYTLTREKVKALREIRERINR